MMQLYQFLSLKKYLNTSKHVLKCLNMSKHVQRRPNTPKHVQTCLNVSKHLDLLILQSYDVISAYFVSRRQHISHSMQQ